MKMLLNEKTKQEKIMNEVQKRRNLFGLGLTSLIAACGAADSAADSATDNTDNTDEDTDNTDNTDEDTDNTDNTDEDTDNTDNTDEDTDNTPEAGIDTRPTANLTADDATKLPSAPIPNSAISVPASNVHGGYPGRTSATNDVEILVTEADRGNVNGGGNLIFRIANGNHASNTLNAAVYTTLTTDKTDLVVSSNTFGEATASGGDLTGAIYIFWNIKDLVTDDVGTDQKTLGLNHLKVAGVNGDVIPANTLLFYKDLGGDAAQADMLFRSGSDSFFNAHNVNILWDVTQHAGTVTKNFTLGTSNGILQIQGGELVDSEFIKINNNESYDMIAKGVAGTYILWDVADYYNINAKVVVNLTGDNKPEHGLLTIIGIASNPEFIKANNNDGYDMIVRGSGSREGNTYILWDVANYHDAADAKAVVDVTEAVATVSHGLLTIIGSIEESFKATEMPKEGEEVATENGYTDIDGGGINDLAFVSLGNTYILFGEKVANRDEESGKAISHTVDLAEVAGGVFYDKDGVEVAGTATGATAIAGFFHFDLDGTDGSNPEVTNVGYRFSGETGLGSLEAIKTEYEAAINPTADGGALSEETYWDIA